ncbi:MAG: zinc metalloprotease [Lacibacter sp.]
MRRIALFATIGILVFASCNKKKADTTASEETSTVTERKCASYEVLQDQLRADPSLQKRMNEIEAFTARYAQNPSAFRVSNDTLYLPVWVNVLYKTTAQNISNAQIQSQIDVLNEDFAALNADYTNTPSIFTGVRSGNIKIKFVWSSANVTRKSTTKTSWRTDDSMKKNSKGGIDPTSPTTTLNLWSCNLANGILGYAQFPGGSSATDGVVILYSAFGSRAKYPGGTYVSTYDLGRTATHEVGHWFNLRHIWGDATCGNDQVGDTPAHNTANYGCPSYPHLSTCSGTPVEMTMNYMDYTNDACMYMFTAGQATRMQATYAVGGPRAGLRP